MTDLVWMKTYIGTETARTVHLSPEEFGTYERLRRHYWQHGTLPDDAERIARIAGLSADGWAAMAEPMRPLIAEAMAELDIERDEARVKRDRKIAAGKIGADKRWGKNSNTNGKAITNSNTNAGANGNRTASALAKPTDTYWQNDSHQHQRQIEGRYEERLGSTRESFQTNGSVSSQEEYEAHCLAKGNSYAAAKGGDL